MTSLNRYKFYPGSLEGTRRPCPTRRERARRPRETRQASPLPGGRWPPGGIAASTDALYRRLQPSLVFAMAFVARRVDALSRSQDTLGTSGLGRFERRLSAIDERFRPLDDGVPFLIAFRGPLVDAARRDDCAD